MSEPSEWQAVWKTAHPKKAPRLPERVRLIVQLGGCANRPVRDGPPEPQAVSRGLQGACDLALAGNTFGPKGE